MLNFTTVSSSSLSVDETTKQIGSSDCINEKLINIIGEDSNNIDNNKVENPLLEQTKPVFNSSTNNNLNHAKNVTKPQHQNPNRLSNVQFKDQFNQMKHSLPFNNFISPVNNFMNTSSLTQHQPYMYPKQQSQHHMYSHYNNPRMSLNTVSNNNRSANIQQNKALVNYPAFILFATFE